MGAIEVRDVSKAFGTTLALDAVSFVVRPGTVHAQLGGNGSGKSTMVKVHAGLHRADAGPIRIRERELSAQGMTPQLAREANCLFALQQGTVFRELSIAENLHFGCGFATCWRGHIRWPEVRAHARAVLERLDIDAAPDTPVSVLGPATLAKVAIARAPQDQEDDTDAVLILDGPTAALPASEVQLLLASLRLYASRRQAIVFVTHRLREVVEVADEATVLRNGRVIPSIGKYQLTKAHLTDLIARPPSAGDDVSAAHRPGPQDVGAGPYVLRVEGLSGGRVRGVHLELRRGEVRGVAGALGSGCSALLQLLFGLQPATAGTVALDGQPTAVRSAADAMHRRYADVPEDRVRDATFIAMTVNENLSMAVAAS